MSRVVALVSALTLSKCGCNAVGSSDKSVAAVQKVIQLLTDMQAQGREAKKAEEVSFAEFKQFCLDTAASKTKEVADGKQLVESLSADIDKLEADITDLGTKIDELQTSITTNEANIKAADAERAKDKASNQESIQDFAESVDALERAIAALQKQNFDRPQAEDALLQLSTPKGGLPQQVQQTLAAFLEFQNTKDDPFLTRDAPEANAYEFQSGGVIDLLKKLRDEFTTKRSEAEKEEMNSAHAHKMVAQDLHDQIEAATADSSDKTKQMQEKKQESAGKSKRLAAAKKDLEEDTEYLGNLKVECDQKGHSFAEKQNLRAQELEAIDKAIEILSSDDVLGNAQTHLPAALLANGGKALAQLRSQEPRDEDTTRRLLSKFLNSEGHRLKSTQMAQLAMRVQSSADPFGKVKRLIEDMIKRLLQEAGEESEHKGWCDTELGTNKQTRTRLADEIDGLTAEVEQTDAMITETTQRLSTLAKEIHELIAAMKEATDLRTAEKKTNDATIQDANEAQKAVQAAVAILKDFYAKAGQATAFIQVSRGPFDLKQPEVKMGSDEWKELANPNFEGEVDKGHKEGMQTFGDKYSGMQDESGGVLAMLEVIQSDFAQLQADTGVAESTAANAHRKFMADSNKSVAVKTKESDMLTRDKATAEADLTSMKKDLAGTQDQLLAADRYYEKLKPQCVDSGMTFDQRTQARQEEIQSLKEALRILSGEDIAF